MTRKIEKEMLKAILEKKNWRKDNTVVIYSSFLNSSDVLLYDHLITEINFNRRDISFCMHGYDTRTTFSRLNAILRKIGAGVYKEKGLSFLTYPDGKSVEISSILKYEIPFSGELK